MTLAQRKAQIASPRYEELTDLMKGLLEDIRGAGSEGMVVHGRGRYAVAWALERRELIVADAHTWNNSPLWVLTPKGEQLAREGGEG